MICVKIFLVFLFFFASAILFHHIRHFKLERHNLTIDLVLFSHEFNLFLIICFKGCGCWQ